MQLRDTWRPNILELRVDVLQVPGEGLALNSFAKSLTILKRTNGTGFEIEHESGRSQGDMDVRNER